MDLPELMPKKPSQRVPSWFFYVTLGIILMIISAFAIVAIRNQPARLPPGAIAKLRTGPIRLDTQTSRFILRKALPALERSAGEEDPFTLFNFNWTEIYWKLAANIKNATPQEILKTQFPLLALAKPQSPPPLLITRPIQPQPQLPKTEPPSPIAPKLSGDPVIFIYHTHTSESYLPVSGRDHALKGKGDIVQVGTYLTKILEEKYGLRTFHSEELHDYYPFRESYLRSQVTAMKTIKEYPSFKVVLDVHRNATPGVDATCSVKGQEMATIALVVGSDKMGLPHPHWKRNYQFASKIAENMNLYYPGLCSGVVLSDARYNQHLHDRSLIIEFGDHNSTMEKVYRSVDLFAEILALTMAQDSSVSSTSETN